MARYESYFVGDQEFQAEIGAFQRVSGGYFLPAMSLFDIQNNPINRLKVGINQTVNQFMQQNIFQTSLIHYNDLEKIMTAVDEMQMLQEHPEYKNPLGMVLGFMLVKKNKQISKKVLDVIQEKLPEIQGGVRVVKLEDVLRYGFLWEHLIQHKVQPLP